MKNATVVLCKNVSCYHVYYYRFRVCFIVILLGSLKDPIHLINSWQCDPMSRQSICRLMQQISRLYVGCLNLLKYIPAVRGGSQYTEKELLMFKN